MAVADGTKIESRRGLGLVSQVFDQLCLQGLRGHLAVGHTRYSTSGPSTRQNAQPVLDRYARFALAHNGNLVNASAFEDATLSDDTSHLTSESASSDSHIMTRLISRSLDLPPANDSEPDELVCALRQTLPLLRGAFTLVLLDRDRLIAVRDPHGLRPLSLGRLPQGWVVASETPAIEAIGGTVIRDVEPAELLLIDEHGPRAMHWTTASPRACLFEYVYLTRPDSVVAGRSVYEARHASGRLLARDAPPGSADLVIGVPDSAIPAALGYAEEAQLPYALGFVRSPYVGRTFMQPVQKLRSDGMPLKLAAIGAVVRGRRLVVVDDSIVRGTTQQFIVRALRDAGAAEVHLRIASPPIRWPCFYGFDFSTDKQLIAASLTVDELVSVLDVDSLEYLSLAGLVSAVGIPHEGLCRACMDGKYPIPQEGSARLA